MVAGLGMDLIWRARANTLLDSVFVRVRTLFLFSCGGDRCAHTIGGDQIQKLVTDPTGASVVGATIEADQTETRGLRVSEAGLKTCRSRYNQLDDALLDSSPNVHPKWCNRDDCKTVDSGAFRVRVDAPASKRGLHSLSWPAAGQPIVDFGSGALRRAPFTSELPAARTRILARCRTRSYVGGQPSGANSSRTANNPLTE